MFLLQSRAVIRTWAGLFKLARLLESQSTCVSVSNRGKKKQKKNKTNKKNHMKVLFPVQQDPDRSWAQQDPELFLCRVQMQILGSPLLTSSRPSSNLSVLLFMGADGTDHPSPAEYVLPAGSIRLGLVSQPCPPEETEHPNWVESELRGCPSLANFLYSSSMAPSALD